MARLQKVFSRWWYILTRDRKETYRPELYYMRGPGPKYREMYRTPVSAK